MSEHVSIAEELRARIEELTRERDNLRAEITKAQESFDDDGPSGWMPGETAIDALIRTRDEAREKVQSRGRKAISPQELNAVVAALHDALLSTPRPNTDALRPRLGWPRQKTYAVVREAVRLGMIERVGVYRWTWFRMPFRRSDKP